MTLADWGVILAILLSALSFGFALWSFFRQERTSVRPTLVFECTSEGTWALHNVGNGPAMDVLVGDQDWERQEWVQIAQCNPIAAGASITLPWLRHMRELAATYTDVGGRNYTSICRAHRTTIAADNDFPKWSATDREYELRTVDPRLRNL